MLRRLYVDALRQSQRAGVLRVPLLGSVRALAMDGSGSSAGTGCGSDDSMLAAAHKNPIVEYLWKEQTGRQTDRYTERQTDR